MEEIWKDIPGYEGEYQVSNLGRVLKVVNGRAEIKKLSKSKCKYPRYSVGLSKDGKAKTYQVSRLVAMAFIPNPDNLPQVNHKDENPLNNHVDNLEWCTAKYNCNYGTRKERIFSKQRIPIIQLTMNGEFIKEHISMNDAARELGVDAGHISDVCNGNREWAYGYKWRYVDEEMHKDAQIALVTKQAAGRVSRKEKMRQKRGKIVKQYTKLGEFIAEYRSSAEASEQTGICRAQILMTCNGQQPSAGGYLWTH